MARPEIFPKNAAVDALADLLVAELENPSGSPVYAGNLVEGIVIGLMGKPGEPDRQNGRRLSEIQMARLQQAAQENGPEPLSVAQMAATVGLSTSSFKTAFKNATGQTPGEWQMDKRIADVQHAMLATTMTLAEIAVKFSFVDQAHLTRAFRKITGETPAAWRSKRKPR